MNNRGGMIRRSFPQSFCGDGARELAQCSIKVVLVSCVACQKINKGEARKAKVVRLDYSSANGAGVPSFFLGSHAGGPTLVGGLPRSEEISSLTCLHHLSTASSNSSQTSGLLL